MPDTVQNIEDVKLLNMAPVSWKHVCKQIHVHSKLCQLFQYGINAIELWIDVWAEFQ